jgi:hypothetical protein
LVLYTLTYDARKLKHKIHTLSILRGEKRLGAGAEIKKNSTAVRGKIVLLCTFIICHCMNFTFLP